jgi:hypothetical protein
MKINQLLDKKKQAEVASQNTSNPLLVAFKDDTECDIRPVPNKEIGDLGFMPVWVHYPNGKIVSKPMLSPKTFGGVDPVLEFIDSSLSEGNLSKDEFKKIASLAPRLSYFLPVVVRGKETEGVKYVLLSGGSKLKAEVWNAEGQYGRLWSELETLLKDDPDADVTHYKTGYDITVKVKGKEKSATGYREYDYKLARRSSALGKTKSEIEAILQNQPSWKDVYPLATTEYLSKALEKYINSGGDTADMDDEIVEETPKTTTGYDEAEIQRQAEQAFGNTSSTDELDDLDELDAVAESSEKVASTDELDDLDDISF